jgi:hypothetical protein
VRRAREWNCPFTGQPADALHHETGRDADGEYLDPELVLPLVRDQHVLEHQIWRMTGIGENLRADSNWLRCCRMGQQLVRLGKFHGDGTVTLPAAFVLQLGLFLLRMAAAWIERKDRKR